MSRRGDLSRRAAPGERVLMDVMDLARRPDSHGVMLLDLSRTAAYRREFRLRHGVALTTVHVAVKAVARCLREYPELGAMVQGERIVQPAAVDVGVSVVGPGATAPVVVLRDADAKPLACIAAELRDATASAARRHEEDLRRLDRIAVWLPVRWLRRRVVAYLIGRQALRQRTVGTIQVTSLGLRDLEMHLPAHQGTALLLALGGVRRRPVVVGDRVEARPSVYLVVATDTRVVQAVHALRAFRRLRRLIEDPRLLEPLPEVVLEEQSAEP